MIMKKLLCRMGFHDFYGINKWEPSIDARTVTKVTFTTRCSRCDFEAVDVYEYDPETGEVK